MLAKDLPKMRVFVVPIASKNLSEVSENQTPISNLFIVKTKSAHLTLFSNKRTLKNLKINSSKSQE